MKEEKKRSDIMYDVVIDCCNECEGREDYGICISECLRRKKLNSYQYAEALDEAIGLNY